MAKENNVNSSVLDKAILEYKQIVEVAKKQLAEGHSQELNDRIAKLLKETENVSLYKEPTTVNQEPQSTVAENEEPAPAGAEAIDMKEASLKEIEEAFDAASDDDEFKVVKTDDTNGEFSLSDIEGEVNEVMAEINAAENPQQVDASQPEQVDSLTQLKKLQEEMGKIIEAINAEKASLALKEQFHQKMMEMMGDGYEEKIGVAECGKMFEAFKSKMGAASASSAAPIQETEGTYMPNSGVKGTHNPKSAAGGGSFPSKEKAPEKSLAKAVTEEEVVAEEGAVAADATAPVVDETHGVGLSSNKLVGGTNAPSLDYKDYAKNKVRLALQKEQNEKLQKRINSLVNENFQLTKAANEAKKSATEAAKLNEGYKDAIEKYRKQLNEMALVSTNIANVNNILVNEGLALSFEDKKRIIKEFKEVSTVEASEETYKKLVKEYTEAKKTIKESVEEKIQSNAIESSSSEEVKASVESNGLNEHVEKLKRLSTYKSKK